MQFLLRASAADFHAHTPPTPTRFRGVRAGHKSQPDRTRTELLCGEFLHAQPPGAWVPFTTIKTSGYEQWLGPQASAMCGDPCIAWVDEDLSATLQRQLDALR